MVERQSARKSKLKIVVSQLGMMASNPLVTVLISELLTKWVKLDQQRTVLNF